MFRLMRIYFLQPQNINAPTPFTFGNISKLCDQYYRYKLVNFVNCLSNFSNSLKNVEILVDLYTFLT